jgi:hypothetical protein
MSAIKKVYLEEGNRFMLTTEVVVVAVAGEVPLKIDLEGINGIVGEQPDPGSEDGLLIGLDVSGRQIFLDSVTKQLYYYTKVVAPHKTYLKEGSGLSVQWKVHTPVSHMGIARLDIDELMTYSDANQAHTEVGNDGPAVGKVSIDDKVHDVYIDHDNLISRLYCYLS